MDPLGIVFKSVLNAFFFIIAYWWIYLPIFLGVAVFGIWKNYISTKYYTSLKWVVLEVKPPPEVTESPKIAENFFSGMHAVYSRPVKAKKSFFEGKVQDWYSFEIISHQGDMKFYIRTLESNRNLVESHLFAQYPNAEITLVEDYISQLPEKLPNEEYDVFGADLQFTKADAFPLKTYTFFESEAARAENPYLDPLAPLAENMSALGPGEYMWLQFVVRPTGGDWTKKAQEEVDTIIGKQKKVETNTIQQLFDMLSGILPFVASSEPEKKEEKEFSIQKLTSGQKFILDQIENKMAKLAFKVTPRFIYIAKKDVFNRSRTTSVIGMFKQLYSNNLNSFKPDGSTATFAADGYLPWLFPSNNGFFKKQQEFERKAAMYKKYRDREFKEKVAILSTEEMATLYHLPGLNVRAPFFPRVEFKKGQSPAGLPTI